MIYWLYDKDTDSPLMSVVTIEGATDAQVREMALREFVNFPTLGLKPFEVPYQRRVRIETAYVRRPHVG
jgi:hypothetical protein